MSLVMWLNLRSARAYSSLFQQRTSLKKFMLMMYRDGPNTVVYIFPPHEVQNVSQSPGSFSDGV